VARIGTGLDRTRTAYDEAMGQLRDGSGNLIGQAEKLRALGVKAKKRLPIINNGLELAEQEDK
jgi:DNA recombination protein RmuC